MKRTLVITSLILSIIAIMALPVWIAAQSDGPGGPPPGEGGPPPGEGGPPSSQEAIDACAEKVENDACEFESPQGETLNGVCENTPKDELVCRPIPPEAIEACENKSEGDTCEMNSPHGDTMQGTCQKKAEQLACTPDGPPSRGEKKAPPEPEE